MCEPGPDVTLPRTAHGTYSATEPVFAMVGVWQLQFRIAPGGSTPFTLVVSDRMVG
jgi:hypothetical protein